MAQSSACCTSGLPASACNTLGLSEYMRVPLPAARMTMFNGFMSWSLKMADYSRTHLPAHRSSGQHRHPVFSALAIANQNLALAKINILHTQATALHQPHP